MQWVLGPLLPRPDNNNNNNIIISSSLYCWFDSVAVRSEVRGLPAVDRDGRHARLLDPLDQTHGVLHLQETHTHQGQHTHTRTHTPESTHTSAHKEPLRSIKGSLREPLTQSL